MNLERVGGVRVGRIESKRHKTEGKVDRKKREGG